MYSYPLDDYDNYAKWRTLNPGRQIIHHKNTFFLLLIVLFFFDILMFLFEYVPPSLLLFKFLSYLIFALNKVMIVEKLTDRFIGYRRLMNFVGVAVTVLTFLGALTEFVRFYIIHHKYDDNGHRIFFYRAEPLSHDQCDFNSFLSTAFGSYNGIFSLLTLFNSSILMKGYVYLTSWPFTIPCVLISVVRGVLVIAYVIKPCFGTSRANILFTLLFLFSFKLLRLSVHTELLYQKEFIELHNSILSTDFLKKIRFLSNKSLFLSIQKLTNLQTFFLEELTKMATTNTIAITEEYLPFIGLLNKNILITTELTMNMNIEHYLKNGLIPSPVKQQSFATYNAFMNELSPRTIQYNNKNNLMTQMKAFFLNNLISQVGEHFTMLQPHDVFKVKVFCHCDPLVCMVRIDALMLKVLLGHACQQIIERIQNTITIFPEFKSKDKQHEIFIWVQPYDFEQNSCQLPFPANHTFKFQDTRLLDILVLDTGLLHGIQPSEQTIPTPLNQQNPKQMSSIHKKQKQFIIVEEDFKHQTKSLGDQYLAIFGFPMTFHQGIINHPHYHSFQRFGMPYLLCPDSVRISAIKENELGNTKIYPVTSNTMTLHSSYKKSWEKAFNLAYQYHKLFHLSKVEKSLYLSLNALDEYPEFHYDANDISGSILAMGSDAYFFYYSDGRCNNYSKTFHQYFNRHSWQLKFVSYSQHNMFTLHNNTTTTTTTTTTSTTNKNNKTNTNQTNHMNYTTNTSFFQNSECILLEYDPQNKRSIINIREYIHMFRTKDYKGLIGIVYHDNGPTSTSSGNYYPSNKGPSVGYISPKNESDTIEIRGLFPKNDYTDADAPDFVLRFPLTQESANITLLKCEQHLIKRMIQTAIS